MKEWKKVGQLPMKVLDFQLIRNNGIIYILGGDNHKPNSMRKTSSIYKIKEDFYSDWEKEDSELCIPLSHSKAIIKDEKVYLIGGIDNNFKVISDIYMSHINNGKIGEWNMCDRLPISLANTMTLLIDDKILLFGGVTSNYYVDDNIYSANIINNKFIKWEVVGKLPSRIIDFEIVKFKDYVYLIGGYDSDLSYPSSNIYMAKINNNYSLDEWKIINELPIPTSCTRSIAIENKMYIIGGEHIVDDFIDDNISVDKLQTVLCYEIENNGELSNLKLVSVLPYPISKPEVMVIDKNIYIFGGVTKNSICLDIISSKIEIE